MRFSLTILALLFLAFYAGASSVDTISVYSKAMKKNIRSVVITPARSPTVKSFPVLYLLHGFGGNYRLWVTKVPKLMALADQYGCIIVCPDGGSTTLYFDNPVDSSSRFETHFIRELMPFVETNYPTRNERRFRALSGLSMGGFGAFFLASRHADLFGAAGSMSGVLDLEPLSKTILDRRQIKDSTCCSINWTSLKSADLGLAFECGSDDYLLPINRNVHKRLNSMNIAHDYTERPGRHEWSYWENAVEYQLLFFRNLWSRQ